MVLAEEIEQLKSKLDTDAAPAAQAELLLGILGKYLTLKSADAAPYVAQLENLAASTGHDDLKAWSLYHHGGLSAIQSDYDAAVQYFERALALFREIGHKKGIVDCYCYIGNVYNNRGSYTEALKWYIDSLKLLEELNDRDATAVSYNNIGIIYGKQGNYPDALQNFYSSLHIREQIGDKHGLASSYNNIGLVHKFQGDYIEALKNFYASLHIREELMDKYGIASAHINIGLAYELQDNYEEALNNHHAALHLYEQMGDKRSLAIAYHNIGNVFEKQGSYPEALTQLFAALDIVSDLGDKESLAASYVGIGRVYVKQGDHAQARSYYEKSIALAAEIGAKETIKDGYKALSDLYKAEGLYKEALDAFARYHEVEKEMIGEQTQRQLTQLGFQHNLEQKEKELEIEHLLNVELKRERDRSESLLLNILPVEVAEELKENGKASAKHFDQVTVLFTDFRGFTTIGEKLSPQQLVDELHECFKAFDEIIGKYNIEKIKTVGDAYMAASGLPTANPNHATDIVRAAIEIRDYMLRRREQLSGQAFGTFEVRLGIHSGSVVAGIVGVKKFAYDIWGDTVNTAARMEQNSEAGRINISQTTYELIKDQFTCHYRGEIEAKNKGHLKMYFVE